MKVTVVIFPGSNCDHDVIHAYEKIYGQTVSSVWHKDRDLKSPDIVVVPGGFSFGDYLRTGALAKISPIMSEVRAFAAKGGSVIGICNGFQILCEAELLPGALLQNIERRFISRFISMKVENTNTPFTKKFKKNEIVTCPVAHMEGNYFADAEGLKRLEGEGRVVVRYCDASGKIDHESRATNPNGALNSIAGICNEKGNVVGMMPHPERAIEERVGFVGSESGSRIFESSLR